MAEHRTERVIEAAARPEWARLPVSAVVIVGFLLAAVIGLTSAASPWLADDGGDSSPPAFVGEAVAVALAAGLCLLLVLWVNTPRRTQAKKKQRGDTTTDGIRAGVRGGSLVLIGGILVAAALLLAIWFLLGRAYDTSVPPPPSTTGRPVPLPPRPAPGSPAPAVFDWFFFALLASIAVVLPLAVIARRRRRASDDMVAEEDDVPEAVVRAVGESIDQIERDPDARRAIIRAYAQMEHAFDDAGVPRRPAEAPFEYLGRALRGVRVSRPAAGRLASLFERARFSQHAVDAGTKEDAIGALREIERQMQGPSS